MIEALALRWAQRLKAAIPDHPTSLPVMKFGLQLMIGLILTLILAISISLFTGKIAGTLTVLASFAILRAVSGGFHFKSAMACTLTTVIGSNLLAFSSFNATTVLVLNGTSLLLAAIYSPSNIEKQTRIQPKHFPRLKLLSMLIICSNFLFMSPVIAVTFAVQSISLIRVRR